MPTPGIFLFIDKFILEHIPKFIITAAYRQTGNEEFYLTNDKLQASIAVMYARGVTGSNGMPSHSLNRKLGHAVV